MKVKKQVWSPDERDTALAAISSLTEGEGNGPWFTNLLSLDDIPDGYSLAVLPVSEGKAGSRQERGVAIVAIPSFDLLAGTDDGRKFIQESTQDKLLNKMALSIRSEDPMQEVFNGEKNELPFSIEEFIESQRGRVWTPFDRIAPVFVKNLRENGFSDMTTAVLKTVLSSARVAKAMYPKIGQDKWEAILDRMAELAEENDMEVDEFTSMKESRNTGDVIQAKVNAFDNIGAISFKLKNGKK